MFISKLAIYVLSSIDVWNPEINDANSKYLKYSW